MTPTSHGGDGDDVITGGTGNDIIFGGAGNDRIVWNSGDGTDQIDGQAGFDTLALSGSNASENIVVAANGDHAAISVDVGNVALNSLSVERIEIGAAGGADHITIGDLTGTGVQQVAVNLASSPTGTSGDGNADTVDVSATGGDDHISIANNGKTIVVTGLAEQVTVDGAEAKNDLLTGPWPWWNDTIDASHLATGHINLTIDGGVGDDTITGSAGNDVIVGGIGNDVLRGGAGNDTFVWNVGDGNDSIDGQTGTDQLVFNGSSASEHIAFSLNGTSGHPVQRCRRRFGEHALRLKLSTSRLKTAPQPVRIWAAHRIGMLEIGDPALVCAVSAAHRGQAFAVCAELVDRIKAQVPIWKEQFFADGTVEWVGAGE